MTEKRTNVRTRHEWETVAVAPLPLGWVNVYQEPDGTLIADAAPALLTERAETRMVFWDEPGIDAPYILRDELAQNNPPLVRVVFADSEYGRLIPACDADNYYGSMTAAEYERMNRATNEPTA